MKKAGEEEDGKKKTRDRRVWKRLSVGSSAVRAPPVAAAAKMRFDAKIAVISTGYSSHKTSIKTFIYVIHNEVIP